MKKLLARVVPAAVLGLLAACSSSPYYDHRFQPAPYDVQVESNSVPGSQMRALVTVLGIERATDKVPDRAVVRFRLENLGTVPATFDMASLGLVSADLQAFGSATVYSSPTTEVGPGQAEIGPGETGVYDAAFPLPAGKRPSDVDLSSVNLRFTVVYGAHRVTPSVNFQRSDWHSYYDDYPRVQVGVGVGVHN